MEINNEIWKDVPGYGGKYQVSDLGNVRSLDYRKTGKTRELKPGINSRNYFSFGLCLNGKSKSHSAHQLVAIAFLNHIPCGYKLVINHIDFNKLNNNVKNLEIVTNRQNANRKHLKSTSKYTGVIKRKYSFMAQINIMGKQTYLGSFKNEYDAHLAYEKALKEVLKIHEEPEQESWESFKKRTYGKQNTNDGK